MTEDEPGRSRREPQYDWPGAMTRKTLAAYLDITEAGVDREIAAGRLPAGFMLGKRLHWRRVDIDEAIDRVCGEPERIPKYRRELQGRHEEK